MVKEGGVIPSVAGVFRLDDTSIRHEGDQGGERTVFLFI
jgi:hypothetical protein